MYIYTDTLGTSYLLPPSKQSSNNNNNNNNPPAAQQQQPNNKKRKKTSSSMAPRKQPQQSRLTSFFGGADGSNVKKKSGMKQTKLNFTPKTTTTTKTTSAVKKKVLPQAAPAVDDDEKTSKNKSKRTTTTPEKKKNMNPTKSSKEDVDVPKKIDKKEKTDDDKENTKRSNHDDNDDDDDESPISRFTPSKRKKQRAIVESDDDDDDDDDDDMDVDPSPRKNNKRNVVPSDSEEDDDNDDDDGDDDDDEKKPLSSLEKPTKSNKNSKTTIKRCRSHDDDDDFMEDSDSDDEEDSSSSDNDDEAASSPVNKSQRMIQNVLQRQPLKDERSKSKTSKITSASEEKPLSDEELLKGDEAWKKGTNVPYAALCRSFSEIEEVSGRLAIQNILTNLLRLVILCHPEDLYDIIYLASNSVAPAYECVELGIGDSLLIKAIGEASGTTPAIIKQKYEVEGDLGSVAQSAKGKQKTLGFGIKPKPLTAKEVLNVYRQIAKTTGNHSQKHKISRIKNLLVRATHLEPKFLIRGLQGKLRIGLAQSTVLISLAHALVLTPPSTIASTKQLSFESAVEIVKQSYSQVPSYDLLVKAALTTPLPSFGTVCKLSPGIPISPMLAKPTKSIQEVLKRLEGKLFTCEYKYDGERAQIHYHEEEEEGKEGKKKTVVTKVFSRNLLDTTEKFPEAARYVKEAFIDGEKKVTSFVMDAEVVAFHRETKKFVPFQVLSTRKKTADDNGEGEEDNSKVAVIVQAFDLMYLNGESLLGRTLGERRGLMKEFFRPVEGKFQFATSLDHTENGDTTTLEEFLDTAVKNQCEGLMIKTLDVDANYEPSRRSLNWLKLKKDYLDGCGDSFDLVPLGAYWGRGKRTGVYGAFLLACYDADSEEFQSVCKIGTGFSECMLQSLTATLKTHVIPTKLSQYDVADVLTPDVWFDAAFVWEVKAADLSKSSTHRGAVDGNTGRGIGLRFPRFERVREDKAVEDATSSEQILDMYYNQESVKVEGAEVGGGWMMMSCRVGVCFDFDRIIKVYL